MKLLWIKESVPQAFMDAKIVNVYKNKVDRASCGNHIDTSLLSTAGKIMARVLLNPITNHLLDSVISGSHGDPRGNQGTIDMTFSVHQIQEKCHKKNRNLYILLVDKGCVAIS